MKAFCNDSYLLIGGCKGKCSIFSIDGIKLSELDDKNSWIWSSTVHPHSKFMVSTILKCMIFEINVKDTKCYKAIYSFIIIDFNFMRNSSFS